MELQKLYVSLLMEMREYTTGLDDAADRARSFGDRLRGTLGGAATAAGMAVASGVMVGATALVGLGASSVGVAREFESSMAVMSTAVDPLSVGAQTTAEAMDILSEASLAVGSDTALVGVSASTSAEAITGLYKAGLSTGEIFGDLQGYMAGTTELGGALRASVDLAAASELDMVQASELAAVTLATFGGELTTTEERAAFVESAMNNFVQTADGSVASVADLQAAFVNVGPTAAAMGMGVEEVNTALGILSTRGITGSEAGTALKSMLVNLQRTTPEVTDTLDALGVSLYDAQGTMYELPEIIGQLEGAMAGMTDEQRQQTVVTLAGSYGMNAMNALLGEGTEGWAAMEASIAGAATMQETAAARTQTLAGAQEALSGVWESFQIKVGTALIPVLTMLADVGASLIEKYGPTLTAIFETVGEVLGGFFTNLQEGMTPLNAFIEAIKGIAPPEMVAALVDFRDNILPGLTEKFNAIVEPIVAAVTNFVSFKDVLVALGIVILATVIPAVVSLVLSMAPILLTVAAVIAVVALLRNAWENNWGGIQEKVAAVIGFVRPLVEGFLTAIRGFWEEHGAAILAGVRSVWEGIKAIIDGVMTVIGAVVGTILGAIKALWERFGDDIMAVIRFAWDTVKTVIGTAIENIKLVVAAFIDLFEGDWEGFKEKIGEIWQNTWDAVVEIIGNLWGLVEPKLREWWDSVKGWFDEKKEALKQIGRDVIDGIVGGLDEVGDKIRETLVKWATEAWDKVKAFFGINSPATKGKEAGRNIGEGFIEGILDTGDEFWGRTETVWQGYYDQLESWYVSLPWEEQPRETIEQWQGGLELLWPALGPVFEEWHGTLEEWYRDQEWESMPLYTTEVWAEEFGQLSDRLRPLYDDYFLTTVLVFRQMDWAGIGVEIVNGMIAGVNSKSGDLYATLVALAREALAQAKAELGVASPSQAFYEVGQAIVAGLIAGIEAGRPELQSEMDRLLYDLEGTLSAASDLGGLGSGFAKLFEERTVAPMEARLEVLDDRIGGYGESIAEMVEGLGLDMNAPGWEWMLNRFATSEYSSSEQRAMAQTALEFLAEQRAMTLEQVELQAELAEQQARLARIEEQRAQLGFLQQQLDLLKLIRDNNLDASILEGIELGLNADAGGLMDAMAAAMRQMIQAAEDELGVHSPSRWAVGLMQNVMGTLAATAERERAGVRDSLSRVFGDVLTPAMSGGGGATMDNSRRMTTYGGLHVTVEGGRGSWIENQDELMR